MKGKCKKKHVVMSKISCLLQVNNIIKDGTRTTYTTLVKLKNGDRTTLEMAHFKCIFPPIHSSLDRHVYGGLQGQFSSPCPYGIACTKRFEVSPPATCVTAGPYWFSKLGRRRVWNTGNNNDFCRSFVKARRTCPNVL